MHARIHKLGADNVVLDFIERVRCPGYLKLQAREKPAERFDASDARHRVSIDNGFDDERVVGIEPERELFVVG